jgi:hypothetical protein
MDVPSASTAAITTVTAEACPARAASRIMACTLACGFACAICACCLGTDVHETSIHVPMFVWGAGVPVADVHGLRSLVDVKPTMLELLGLPRHPRPYLGSRSQ